VNPLVNEVLVILEQHALVKATRVVNYDETPSGRLEVKIRCDLSKSINCKFGFIPSQSHWTMHINYSQLFRCCAGTMLRTTNI